MEEIHDCLGRLACCGDSTTGYISALYKGVRTTVHLTEGETFSIERQGIRTDVTLSSTDEFIISSYKIAS